MKSVTNTYPMQYLINKARSVYCPYLFNKFEANQIAKDNIPGLWLGSMSSSYDKQALDERNIKNVIIAVWDMNPPYPDDFNYLKVPLIDRVDQPIGDYFKIVVEFIDSAFKRGEGVLVHCAYGISRSSTLVCAYLMKKFPQLSIHGALNIVKKDRPIAEPNIGFIYQLLGKRNYTTKDPYSIFNS